MCVEMAGTMYLYVMLWMSYTVCIESEGPGKGKYVFCSSISDWGGRGNESALCSCMWYLGC